MTLARLCIVLVCVILSTNGNIFREPGKYIEKIERSPEREYYRKVESGNSIENEVQYPENKRSYEEFEKKKEKWRNDEDFERKYSDEKAVEYSKKYDNNYKNYGKDYKRDYHEGKYKKEQKYVKKDYKNEDYDVIKRDVNSEPKEFNKDFKHGEYQDNKFKHLKIDPPDHTKIIAMARYVVHEADWASVATLSTLSDIKGFPFTNIASMSDGPVGTSTGITYFYLTPLDFTHKDYIKDNRITVTVSLAETGYCAERRWEADDPQCARIMLSGKIQRVTNTSQEYEFARNALFSRHPSMANLPKDHGFYIAKLKIGHIVMLDWFGGPKFVNVRDYLNFKPSAAEETKKLVENNFVQTNNPIQEKD